MINMGDTTTETTTIPEMTPEEAGLLNLARDGLLTSYLEESGYHVEKSETTWETSADAKEFTDRKATLNNRISTLEAQLKEPALAPHGGYSRGPEANLQNQLNQAMGDLNRLEDDEEEARGKFKPEITYETTKAYDLEAKRIGEEKGYDSPEFKVANDAALGRQEAAQ